jgi:hypothetical protein
VRRRSGNRKGAEADLRFESALGAFTPGRCPDRSLSRVTTFGQIQGTERKDDPMKKYLIERHIPGVHKFTAAEYAGATEVSNAALAKLAPRIQWVESYVTEDKTLCVYIADDESVIHEHSKLSGFPANKITEVGTKIDPMTRA